MKIFLDCLPCVLRQILEASRVVTENEEVHENIMIEAVKELSSYKDYSCTPELVQKIHQIVKDHSQVEDPYRVIKEKDMEQAFSVIDKVKEFMDKSDDKLEFSLKAAATGNIMDSALSIDLDLNECFLEELKKPFYINHIDDFKEDLNKSKTVLVVGDNAGEAVFDSVFIQILSESYDVIYAVREKPIINDATVKEASKAGVDKYAKVISSGCSAPGTVIGMCNEEFKDVFYKADMVISKGQGNFEGLSDVDRKIYFILKAKCMKVANILGTPLGEYVLINNNKK